MNAAELKLITLRTETIMRIELLELVRLSLLNNRMLLKSCS
jgi:hypothetical protein